MIDLHIRLFATLRDRAGQDKINVSIIPPATVADMLKAVESAYPKLASSLPTVLVAVNKNFASPDPLLQEKDEIALFPPVSGGELTFPNPTYFAITAETLDIQAIYDHITEPSTGAIVSFTGLVRGQTTRDGLPPKTLYLEYEAYNTMAKQKMAQIAQEIWQKWPQVKGIAIVQRIGKLDISDITTFIACASGHRDQGVFAAARYGIDRLKEIVPVWKKEVGPENSIWVEGKYQPTAGDNL